MDSPSRREPGSEGEGRPGGHDEKGGDRRVVRVNRPLGRPKPQEEAPPPKKVAPAKASLKPGDRLWSKPKKERRAAGDRTVYLSSDDYRKEHPEAPEGDDKIRRRSEAEALPRAVGPASRSQGADRRPGKPAYAGAKGKPPYKGKPGAAGRFDKGPSRGKPERFEKPPYRGKPEGFEKRDRPAGEKRFERPQGAGKPYEKRERPAGEKRFEKPPFKGKPAVTERRDRPTGEKRFEKPPFHTKPAGYERRERPAGEKRFERTDRPAKPFEKRERPTGEKRFEKPPFERKPAGFEKRERPAGEKRFDRPSKPFEKRDRPAKPFEKHDRPSGEKRFDRPDRPAKPFEKRDRPSGEKRFEKPPLRGKSDRFEKPGFKGKADRFEKKERPAGDKRFERPGRPERPHAGPPPAAHVAPSTGVKGQLPFQGAKENLRAAAARVVFGVLDRAGQLKALLQTEQSRFRHEGDRALIREMAAGVLRHLPHLDWCIAKAASRGLEATRPEFRALLRVGLYQILFLERVPVYAAVDQCVEAAKSQNASAAGFVNGILRTAAEHREAYRAAAYETAGGEGLALRYGMPRWLVDRYRARFGDEGAERTLAALQEPADSCLFFPDAGRLAQARPILEREGFLQRPDSAFPLTVHVSGGNPATSEAFDRGLFYVSDPASQVPALLLPLEAGGRALDLCAAPGGKSVVLAGRLAPGGWVLAADLSRRRMRRIEENLGRLEIPNVRMVLVDAAKPLPFKPEWQSVLLDAPCSALGTLRRNPEIRWQVQPVSLPALAQRQAALLRQAAAVVAPGGYLLYSVCSLEEEETTAVVRAFLAEERGFKAAPLDPPAFLAPLLEGAGPGAAYCMPHRHAWDGFFVALLRRKEREKE